MPINPNAAGIKRKHNDISYTANNSGVNHVTDESLPARIAYQELAARLKRLEEVMQVDDHKFPNGSLQSIIFNRLKKIAESLTNEQDSNSNNDNNTSESGLIEFVQRCVQGLASQLKQFPDDMAIQQDGGKLRDYLEDFLTWQASLTSGFPVDIHTYHKILSYVDSEVEATALSLTCKAHYLNSKAHRLPSHLQWLKTPARNYAISPVGSKDLIEHEGPVTCLTTLPNGFIVSGSDDKTLKIWNPESGECVMTLLGHEDFVACLTTLPNGYIVSWSWDETVKIWSPETGECVKTLEWDNYYIGCLTTLPNGCIVSGSGDRILQIWNPEIGECIKSLEGHKAEVSCLSTLSNGFIVSGDGDGTIKIWDPEAGQCVSTLVGHKDDAYCLTTLPNGFIVSGSWDKTLKIWDPETAQCVRTLKGHNAEVFFLTTLPNGYIVSGSDDETFKIWDPAAGQCVSTLAVHKNDVYCLTALANGSIVSGSLDKTIKIWSFKRLMPKHDIKSIAQKVTPSLLPPLLLGNSNSCAGGRAHEMPRTSRGKF